jgi:hypothetical protein
LQAEVRQRVEDDEIVLLSQKRVDAVILQIICEQQQQQQQQQGGGGSPAVIRAEDMSMAGAERWVYELWIELLDILRDNAELRKNNLILHHERQQLVTNSNRTATKPNRPLLHKTRQDKTGETRETTIALHLVIPTEMI